MCCLCNYICKWLDVQVFSDKDYKPYAPSPASSMLWLAGDVKELARLSQRVGHEVPGVVVWPLLLKWGLGWEMLGDISYHKATLQSESKHSIHIHIHKHWRQCFIGYPNTSNFVKSTPLCVVFSTLFSVFGYTDETLSLVFDILLSYI